MFVGVIVENFHKCRENQEQEEITRRAAQNVRSVDRKQRSKSTQPVCVWGGERGASEFTFKLCRIQAVSLRQ